MAGVNKERVYNYFGDKRVLFLAVLRSKLAKVAQLLDGGVKPKQLAINEGNLVLFRGRNALHRVTPTEGDKTRMLVVLAYNAQPGIELSESARMTFYGRL
ncbi:Uncharacterised protein [Serratia fonticola]|nr:Uncharacterised protein [Serratia fonticola]